MIHYDEVPYIPPLKMDDDLLLRGGCIASNKQSPPTEYEYYSTSVPTQSIQSETNLKAAAMYF